MLKIIILFIVLGSYNAKAESIEVKFDIETKITCTINGKRLEEKFYNLEIPMTINEYSVYKPYDLDYSHPAEGFIEVLNMEGQGSVNKTLPKYALRFGTAFLANTGAYWGSQSSLIYFNSIEDLAPVKDSAGVFVTKAHDFNDYCSSETLVVPRK